MGRRLDNCGLLHRALSMAPSPGHQATLLSAAVLQLPAPLASHAGARRPQQPCPSYQPRPANSATSGSMAAPRKRPAGSLHKAASKETSPAASQQDAHVGVMLPPARPGRGPSPPEGAWAANGAAGNDAGDPEPAAGLLMFGIELEPSALQVRPGG